MVKFKQSDNIRKLIFLHANVYVFDVELHIDVLLDWVKHKVASKLDWFEKIAVTVNRNFILMNIKDFFQFFKPKIFGWKLAKEVEIICFVVKTKVGDVKYFVKGVERCFFISTVHEDAFPFFISRIQF